MHAYLRQSTASQSRIIGPFVDDTDFKTPKTTLTIANTDIKLMPQGGASANKNSGGATHRVNGEYSVTFDATDTGTVGELKVSCLVSGAMIVSTKFLVVTAAVYDQMFAATAPGAATPIAVAALPDANANADALLDRANGVETGWTLRQVLRAMGAVLLGKSSGANPGNSTSVVYRAITDSKARVTGAVDGGGNRTNVSIDVS